MMPAPMSTRSVKQIQLNLVLLVLVVGAIYSSAARLLPEDHDFSISHTTAKPAPHDLKLNLVVDSSSGSQQPKLHHEVARSNSARDGIQNLLHVTDIAHPGGLTTISADTAEISFEGKNIRSRPHWSSSSGYNNNKNAKEFVFNVFPKGPVTPSGPSHKGYATVTERRLSASEHSPGVGRMQEGRQRFLGSVPSPGVGH